MDQVGKSSLTGSLLRSALFAVLAISGVVMLVPSGALVSEIGAANREHKSSASAAASDQKTTETKENRQNTETKENRQNKEATAADDNEDSELKSSLSWFGLASRLTIAGLCGVASHAAAFAALPLKRRRNGLQKLLLTLASVLIVLIGYVILQGLLWYAPDASPYSLNLAVNWPYWFTIAVFFTGQFVVSNLLMGKVKYLASGNHGSLTEKHGQKAAASAEKITQLWIASPFAPWRRVKLIASRNGIVVLERPSLLRRKKHNILYVNIGSVGVETSWLVGSTININSVRWGERHLKIKKMPERKAEIFADLVLDKINKLGGERK